MPNHPWSKWIKRIQPHSEHRRSTEKSTSSLEASPKVMFTNTPSHTTEDLATDTEDDAANKKFMPVAPSGQKLHTPPTSPGSSPRSIPSKTSSGRQGLCEDSKTSSVSKPSTPSKISIVSTIPTPLSSDKKQPLDSDCKPSFSKQLSLPAAASLAQAEDLFQPPGNSSIALQHQPPIRAILPPLRQKPTRVNDLNQVSTQVLLDHLSALSFDRNPPEGFQKIWFTLEERSITRTYLQDLCVLWKDSDFDNALNFQPYSICGPPIFNSRPSRTSPTKDSLLRSCIVTKEAELPRTLFHFLPIGNLLIGQQYTDWIVVLGTDKWIWFLRHETFGINFTSLEQDLNDQLNNAWPGEDINDDLNEDLWTYDAHGGRLRREAQKAQKLFFWGMDMDIVKAGKLNELAENDGQGFGRNPAAYESYPGRWKCDIYTPELSNAL